MAYYIDDAKKTAVKIDGKSIYGWNRETRLFDLPVTGSSPKSQMVRCSDFEARQYLFTHDSRSCSERIAELVSKIRQMPEGSNIDTITVVEAETRLKEVVAFKAELLPETLALQTAVREYAMEMSNVGQYLATGLELLENNLDLAKDALEFAKLKETAEKCKGGHCEERTVYQDCDKKKT